MDCMVKEQRVNEKLHQVCDLHNDAALANRELTDSERRRKYVQRSNLFMGKAFTLCKASYGSKAMEKEKNQIEKVIIEYGGSVYEDEDKAKYIIQEDGINPDIWSWFNPKEGEEGSNQGEQQNEQPKLIAVHFRFIQDCIKENTMLRYEDAMHLCPLPQKVPVKAFKTICIEMANITTLLDNLVFSSLVKLYGFKR